MDAIERRPSFFARHRIFRRGAALISALTVTACATWQTAAGTPDAVVAGQPDAVRVTLVQGYTVVLHRPAMVGDTLTGYVNETDYSRTRILLRDVKTVETQHAKEGAALVAGVVVVGLIVLVAVAADRMNFGNLAYLF